MLFAGSLIALVVFLFTRSRSKTSPTEVQNRILQILTEAGYSQRQAMYWASVAGYETGGFNSKLYKLANNLFGMKVAQVRQSTRSGVYNASEGAFSAYASVDDSVEDLVLYLTAMRYPPDFDTLESFIAFMRSKNYFEQDPTTYLAGVRRYLNELV